MVLPSHLSRACSPHRAPVVLRLRIDNLAIDRCLQCGHEERERHALDAGQSKHFLSLWYLLDCVCPAIWSHCNANLHGMQWSQLHAPLSLFRAQCTVSKVHLAEAFH